MTDSTLTITVSRLLVPGAPDPLRFSAALGDTDLGIVGYQQPALRGRVAYAPDSPRVHGSAAIGAAWDQAVLGWDWFADLADSEADVQAAYDEVTAAIGQFTYTVTTQVNGAPERLWKADMGAVVPSARSYEDLFGPETQVFAVTVPVYPLPGV